MSKRHHSGDALLPQLRRCQELILARTGVDEFYETIRIILAKRFWEETRQRTPISYFSAQELLRANEDTIAKFLEGGVTLCSPAEVAEECLRVLAPTRISETDYSVLHTAFEQMTGKFYKSDKGQYFTPSYVVDFCMDVLRLKEGETFCDPACGSGAFLKAAYETAGKNGDKFIFGFDISKRAAKTAALLSFLACDSAIEIEQLDSLTVGGLAKQRGDSQTIEDFMQDKLPGFIGFDAIATNPPFAGDVSNAEFLDHYQTPKLSSGKIERDVVFLERCIALLKPGGRLAIVLPDNKISGVKFANLRKWLLSNTQIIAAVSLHSYTFRPYTSQKACVLFLEKTDKPGSNRIHLYRSDKSGKTSNGTIVYNDSGIDHDLKEISEDLIQEWIHA